MVCECLPSIGQAIFVLASFFIGKFVVGKLLGKSNEDVHKKDWKKDVVYLYQFPRSPVVPNLSPFCLKVETWLRAHDITYEVVATNTMRSSNGLLPFVELNGKQIADSQMIIIELEKQFKVQSKLSKEQEGISRAVDRLVDGNTFYAIIYSKIVENGHKLLSQEVSGFPIPGFLTGILGYLFGQKILARIHAHGIGKFPPGVIYDQVRRDLAAVDGIRGDKPFICGEEASIADFTLFGHLASCYFLPFDQPVKDMLDHEFPRIREHLHRMRARFWSDWEELH
ncbi:hypothetical protein L596_002197 [Steinernema carpocapsae]|uniref:Thioredoxin-like fold domain-containing protein n=1 Tax=Steinernema carpocapsae TaxID=34508 RepID=A0A4U8UNT2_STECR|nr:hypothetical protein L596_002197 [Steinernema carpocapsae]